MASTTVERPVTGQLVQVRGERWVVSEVRPAENSALVTLQSVEEGRYDEKLSVIWEIEPVKAVLRSRSLPEIEKGGFDTPDTLQAFLDATRWSAVTSADVKTLQAPFRSGVAIEDYQLEPVSRALDAPRVNLLLADDVGLGKTIEAGLVAQELLLRQRGKKIMIVCPAGLTVKWKDEMADKFGLEFTVIDSAECARVRREHGSAANPFEVYPHCIVSLPWLRAPKAQRLLDEVLPPDGPTYPRTFDLLILDEAHHVAPAAPKQVYAVDSQQTKLIRRLAPHFTHRLFLSATPHNGYQASFTALLEILDDQRFARGVEPAPSAVKEVVIRRLKTQIVEADGTPRFKERDAKEIPVAYPDDEREIHDLLKEFTEARRRRLGRSKGRRAADLVTLLLKKRLFSSPYAFGRTIETYAESLKSRTKAKFDPQDEWFDDIWDEFASLDDEALDEAEQDTLGRTRDLTDTDADELEILDRMRAWALKHDARPDAKAEKLIEYLRSVCKPGEDWTNERVIVFTEYRDTKDWLAGLLRDRGMGGERVAELDGTMNAEDRERLRVAFQKAPSEHPVRILLATDAASEGIDLQNHCHRLVNYDIPFNPNKLEQRIGRIDRYGQKKTPEVFHFVGTGWGHAVDNFEADLEFLSRIAKRVAQVKEDLGPVNAVLSEAVQRRLLGERVDVDVETVTAPTRAAKTGRIAADSNVREQVARLQEQVKRTVEELGITPRAVQRVVDTALSLARQQPLKKAVDPDEGVFEVPILTGSWERAGAGLYEKQTSRDQTPRRLPITFDQKIAARRDDVVLAHLNHPLVAMSTRLLRAAVSDPAISLNRVTAVVSDDPALTDVLVGAYSRFVLLGNDGLRLHEEVLHAGGWMPESGRFRRLENLGELARLLDHGLNHGTPATPRVQDRLVERWAATRAEDGLMAAIEWRRKQKEEQLQRRLLQRREAEENRIRANLEQFKASLRSQLDKGDESDTLFAEIQTRSREEIAQYHKDRKAWEERLRTLDAERDRELEQIAARYASPEPHSFPVAVIFVVPRREAQ